VLRPADPIPTPQLATSWRTLGDPQQLLSLNTIFNSALKDFSTDPTKFNPSPTYKAVKHFPDLKYIYIYIYTYILLHFS
jgi:hypothetical protein